MISEVFSNVNDSRILPVAGDLGPGSWVQQRRRRARGTPAGFGFINKLRTTLWSTCISRAVLSLGQPCSLVPQLSVGAWEHSKHVTHGAARLLKKLNLFHFLNCSWEKIRSH